MTPGCTEPSHARQEKAGPAQLQAENILFGVFAGITCVGLEVLGGDHDHEANGALVAEHLVGPAADGAHALDSSDAIVGDEHLGGQGQELAG